MKEIILIGAVMAMFVFGFYIMDKVDHFLNDNYSRLEVMEHTSALRIAMEDSFIAASGLEEDQVRKIIENHTTSKLLGVFGEETVNVVKVNIELGTAMGLLQN